MSKSPKKWYDVYRGQDEYNFFIALARHKEYKWRTIAAIAKEANITELRVEQILDKYAKFDPPMVHPNPAGDHQWGYWERVKDHIPAKKKTLSGTDHENRMSKNSYSSTDGFDAMLHTKCYEYSYDHEGNYWFFTDTPQPYTFDFVVEKPHQQLIFDFMKDAKLEDTPQDSGKSEIQLLSADNEILATFDTCIPMHELKPGDTLKCSWNFRLG